MTKKTTIAILFASVVLFSSTFLHAGLVIVSDDFSGSSVNADGNIRFDEISTSGAVGSGQWEATGGSNWNISGGQLCNSGTSSTARHNEGPLVRVVDVSSLNNTADDELEFNIDFTTANPNERFFVHIRGYTAGTDPAGSANLVNLGATNGNAWNDAFGAFTGTGRDIYNLHSGVLNNHNSNFSFASSALQLTSGVSGPQSVNQTFDLSTNPSGAQSIADFDYIAVIFSRDANPGGGGFGDPPSSLKVSNFSLELTGVPEPSSLVLFSMIVAPCLVVRRRK